MPHLATQLLELYGRLGTGVLIGWILGRQLSKVVPTYLGKFLFWVGVPISIFAFLRQADLSGPIWIAALVAWIAILLSAGLAWAWLQGQKFNQRNQINVTASPLRDRSTSSEFNSTQGSFILSAMVGNTGYLGYPIVLTLLGTSYFGWALFYDMLGTTLGAYGLGVVLAARFGMGVRDRWQLFKAILQNPALWSFVLGLSLRHLPLPPIAEKSLNFSAWTTVALSLVLIGMRLSYLSSWGKFHQALISLSIKMLLVPLVLGIALSLFGLSGSPLLVIVLQMAMPPAFATLVLAEAYDLDRDLAVTALAAGLIGLLFTLPVWLWLFG